MDESKEKKCDEIAVSNFIDYLRFPTVHPDPDYGQAVSWLLSKGQELDLICTVIEIVPNNPIVLMCWKGRQPELPAILLNSHMDVVPVVEEKWSYPPFGGVQANGKIFGRGSQDMKGVGIQQLESVRRLKARGISQLRRTIYLSFVPDEELGGKRGMKPFVEGLKPIKISSSNELRFADLNIGLCLDEGLPSETDAYTAYYDERKPCWINVHFEGNAGHGLALIENTAAEKFRIFLNHMMQFRRDEQMRLVNSHGKLSLGDITTVNMTMINGGVQCNVVPARLSATFDVRLTPSFGFENFKHMLNHWANDAGGNIQFEYINNDAVYHQPITCPDEKTNPYWSTLLNVCDKYDVPLVKQIFPGATDARFIRHYHELPQYDNYKSIEAIGFTPIRYSPILLHNHDEYVEEKEFLHGCHVYTDLVYALGELQ